MPSMPHDPASPPDWEAFYRDYRLPGYVAGFELTTKLGGGAFGLVFRARRMSIGKDYAIKFLKVDDGEVRRAVLAELEQVKWFAQIDHPNLVSIEDRGEVEQDLRLELGAPGPTGPRPPWDHLPAWSSGVTRVVTGAQGRLVAREGALIGQPVSWQLRWSPDGRSGEVVVNDEPPAELRCGPGRREVQALGWTEVWSCPAK